MTDYVIIGDEQNKEIGTEEKMKAHEEGLLHRAFSIVIYNSKGEMLLQKRAATKYHSQNLWSNACCSHPRPNERLEDAARRRLNEELGLECKLQKAFSFIYRADVGIGLIEHEYDFVFISYTDAYPKENKVEVAEYKWMDKLSIKQDVKQNPEDYTSWFRILFENLK